MHIDCDLTGNFYIYNAYIYIFYTNEEVNDVESCKDEVHQEVTENDTDINQIIKSFYVLGTGSLIFNLSMKYYPM